MARLCLIFCTVIYTVICSGLMLFTTGIVSAHSSQFTADKLQINNQSRLELVTKNKPRLQLATKYRQQLGIEDYLVSEKLDGVRGYWNGRHMLTRGGNHIQLPDWFTKGFPSYPVDGELWMGRNTFDKISTLVRTSKPNPDAWRDVRFMVFDLPAHEGGFELRYQYAIAQLSHVSTFIQVLEQVTVESNMQLSDLLKSVVNKGGEGLMLHHKRAHYRQGRNPQLMKLKIHYDAEAKVIGYTEGQGKFAGMTGALVVQEPSGVVFRLGSGLSNAQRQQPPAIGSIVTYQYHGKTKNGVPRFASFLRVNYPEAETQPQKP